MAEINKREIEEMKRKIEDIGSSLDISSKRNNLKSLELESNRENFWDNQEHAKNILTQIAELKEEIDTVTKLREDIEILYNLAEEQEKEKTEFLQQEFDNIKKKVLQFESLTFLTGKYDKNNATLSIHSGQGGTEANDWTEMLLRMYTMYVEKKGWKYQITDIVKGNEAGISTVSIDIYGKYAYGILKREHGTHRLVRLSPFNTQNLRQTSFAGVEVIPIMEDLERDIQIPNSDIEFKAIRASGPGGQSVNKTSSAVQITHIPTGIVVKCSQERSQLKNREKAMQILKGKLWRIVEENRLEEISEIKGDYTIAGWGSQIRNYILHPYKLVKDLRTGIEITNPESVLDGNIEELLEAQLRIQ